MKIKKKGKVHPSPSSSSSKESRDSLSVLNLLPATILNLTTLLSLDDRQVLAYMITRSLQTPTTHNNNNNNPSPTKPIKKNNNNNNIHQVPMFECDCFECYTSYWCKWDSSSNRELIHQVIEAFEDHLASSESSPTKKTPRGARRRSRRTRTQPQLVSSPPTPPAEEEHHPPVVQEEEVVAASGGGGGGNRKGLARIVLPDLLGLFNSRLWGLWNPDV